MLGSRPPGEGDGLTVAGLGDSGVTGPGGTVRSGALGEFAGPDGLCGTDGLDGLVGVGDGVGRSRLTAVTETPSVRLSGVRTSGPNTVV
ncbi:hypothetical protein, partial [Kitasatospora sp. NPDC087314]|uniref:hypothetical protein n=1 Tax=Kitasatospora sp. NPDC087314 TaxID=3364068 RepID=UPI003827F0D9